MFKVTELPKRPYANFDAFLTEYRRRWRGSKEDQLPCSHCYGSGKVHRDEDRDPIEGWKLAPLYTCDPCGGSGKTTIWAVKALYQGAIDAWRTIYATAKIRRDKELLALAKVKRVLSLEEMVILGLQPERKKHARVGKGLRRN
jgi:hypothetical protein